MRRKAVHEKWEDGNWKRDGRIVMCSSDYTEEFAGNLNKNYLNSDPELIRLPPEEASRTLLPPSTEFHLKMTLENKLGFLLCCPCMNLSSQTEQSYVSSVQYIT